MLDRTHSVAELAATRRQIMDCYNGSENQTDQLLHVEAAIIAAAHDTDADRQIKCSIMHENGEPDWNDRFIQKLALSLC
jgi:hypothetical protein